MRNSIYSVLVLIIFTALITGIDNYYGENVRIFCMILFPIWVMGLILRNWKEIVEFFKIIYGFDKENDKRFLGGDNN